MRPVAIPRWDSLVAVFGGTFDPPHRGHVEAVRGLFTNPGVSRVLVMPTPVSPEKTCVASLTHRIELLRTTFAEATPPLPGPVEVSLFEVEHARFRGLGAPAHSFDTIQELKKEFPNLAFVIGADQLAGLHTWFRFPDVLDLCHWIVLIRKPNGEDQAKRTLQTWEASSLARALPGQSPPCWRVGHKGQVMVLSPTEAPAISSTEIRTSISRLGFPPAGTLSPSVFQYLQKNRLYGCKSSEQERATPCQ